MSKLQDWESRLNRLERSSLWFEDELKLSLDFLAENAGIRKKFVKFVEDKVSNYLDRGAIIAAINSGDNEVFDVFDSDIGEQYIELFKKAFFGRKKLI